jgi:hypothetical protein
MAILGGSHLLFVLFLRQIGRHFADGGVVRQAMFYLVFFCIFAGLSLITVVSMLPRSYRYSNFGPDYSSPNMELFALGGLCWGCLSLFLGIALISLVQQTRSLLRDRMATEPRRY